MSIGARIKKLRIDNDMSQVDFADMIGVSKQTLYKYENGIVTNIPSDKIESIAKAFHVQPAFIMGWEDAPVASNIIPIPETKKVPLIGTIACGEPILAVENIESYIYMESDIHADFALRCKGDSMINARIFDGDIVYIRKQPDVENGEIAAVLINGLETEATLKRVYKTDSSIRLCAANPTYTDIVYEKDAMNNVTIIGKAVAFLSTVR